MCTKFPARQRRAWPAFPLPDSILLKSSRLTPSEQKILRRHPIVGEQICAPLKSFNLVLPIIRHHHEKMDGSGYPDGLRGEQIPVSARVLQIVDIFDALTTERPYKPAFSMEKAFAVMKKELQRGWLDANVYGTFEAMILSRVTNTTKVFAASAH